MWEPHSFLCVWDSFNPTTLGGRSAVRHQALHLCVPQSFNVSTSCDCRSLFLAWFKSFSQTSHGLKKKKKRDLQFVSSRAELLKTWLLPQCFLQCLLRAGHKSKMCCITKRNGNVFHPPSHWEGVSSTVNALRCTSFFFLFPSLLSLHVSNWLPHIQFSLPACVVKPAITALTSSLRWSSPLGTVGYQQLLTDSSGRTLWLL